MKVSELEKLISTVPDFPKPGIQFKDITPLLENPKAFNALVEHLVELVPATTKKLVAIESRGFILGSAMAQAKKCGLVLARKKGKLPRETVSVEYALEYGTDQVEIHKDAIKAGEAVTIVDDVLATGGTAEAVEKLCKKVGGKVDAHVFLMEIDFLKGRKKLSSPVESLLTI